MNSKKVCYFAFTDTGDLWYNNRQCEHEKGIKMMKIGFDNEKYLKLQSEHIRERIAQFDNKLYLEFGGKVCDDYHASRVLPGFQPDSKLQMLLQLKDQAEIVIVVSAEDIESGKIRGDYGITYDLDTLRLIDAFKESGLYVGSVCLTKFAGQLQAENFERKLADLGIRSYRHFKIPGYKKSKFLRTFDLSVFKNAI